MKKFLLCLMVLTLTFGSFEARASDVAILNLEEIVNNSTAMTKLKKKLDVKKVDMEKKLKAQEKDLSTEKANLETQIKILSQDVAQQKINAFQEKVVAFQSTVKDNENELQKSFMDAYLEVTNNIKDIVVEMKQENKEKYNFSVVLPKASVIYSDKDLDISAEVLARLNKRLKEIK